MSELQRVYERRDKVASELAAKLTNYGTEGAPDLHAEIKLLQAKLEAAELLAEERKQHLDDLRKLLSGPDSSEKKQKSRFKLWWR